MVAVLVLGAVEVLGDDAPEPIKGDKQRVLMAHLALASGEPVSSDLLIEELWGTPVADPLHALQAHVSRLRRATALPIRHTSGGYQLDLDGIELDAARFEQLVGRAELDADGPESTAQALQEALDLWRGPALSGLPDTPGLNAHRVRLDLLRDQAVTELVDAHFAADRPEAALPLLHEYVELNPLDERRWGQLILALDRTGQRAQALEAYARARTQLVEHLGLEPNAQLQQIQREILAGPHDDVAPRPSTPLGAEPPDDLVGRNGAWETLVRTWEQAQERQLIAVLSGEPGIGKTHLASRFTATLTHVPVHTSRCHAAHSTPYGLLAQLIRSDCAPLDPRQVADRFGPHAGALRGLVPDLVAKVGHVEPASPEHLDPQVEHHRITLALRHWLERTTRSGPLCLVIDDLQWADADSLRLLTELWSDPRDLPILWLATLRDHEHLADSPGATLVHHAVRPSESVVRIPLEGLDRPAVAGLMRSAMRSGDDAPLSPRTVNEVLAATAGNPLFILETARHLRDRFDDGTLVSGPIPPSLTTIVEIHLDRLNTAARELLDVAAVVGEEFDPILVGTAADLGPQEIDEFLAVAQHFRLMEPAGPGWVRHRFRHSLVRAVVLQNITPVRRAQLHLRVARAAESNPYTPERLHVLAHHHVHAVSLTGPDEAIRHLLTAAEASLDQRAPAIALDLCRQARDLLTSESPMSQRCEVHLGLGVAGFRVGADHRDDLLTAARLANDIGDVDRLVRAAVTNNRGWYSSIAEVDRDRVAVLEAALAMLPDSGYDAARSRLLSLWALENVRDPSRRQEALDSTSESLQVAEELGDEHLVGEVMCHRYAVLYATLADPVGTFDFAKKVDTFAHARIDRELQLSSAIAVAQSAMMLGDFTTADHALTRSEQLATELGHTSRGWMVRTWTATRVAMRGDVERGEVLAAEALEMGTNFRQADAFTWYAGQLFAFHHMTGRLGELVDAVEEQVTELHHQIPAWRAAYALTLTSAGRSTEARAIIDEFCAARFEQLPVDVLYLHGLTYLSDATVEMEYAEAAPDLYAALLPYAGMVANNATIDAGPVDLRLGGLAGLIGDRSAAQRHLRAAETFCHANDASAWLNHVARAQSRLS